MSFRIDRTRRAFSATAGTDRKASAQSARPTNLPVPVGPVIEVHRPDNRDHGAALDAQLLGQDGQKRGLRGGQTVLDQARCAYNSVEWSGRYDRRARKGRLARDVA